MISTSASTRHRAAHWLLGLLPVLGLSILLTACGGSSSSSASPTTTRPTTARGGTASSSFAKYTQCLTSHGVPAGTGGFGRRGGGAGAGGTGAGSTGSGTTGSGSAGAGGAGSGANRTRPTIPAQYQKAFQACASLRPTGGFGGFGGGLNSAQAAAYRNCLQIHGVKLPSPPTTTPGQPPSTGGFGRGNGFAQVRNSPAFQAAAKACASLLPSRPGSTSSTTTAASA